jgi:hypothetical protein
MEASTPRAASAAVIKLFAGMDGVDPTLLKAIETGTYVVDPRAIADAIVRRHQNLEEARRLSVLVTGHLDYPSVGRTQFDEPSAGMDVA